MKHETHRHGQVKSAWAKLLPPSKLINVALVCLNLVKNYLILENSLRIILSEKQLQERMLFQWFGSDAVKKQRHINVGELRSCLRAEQLAGLSSSLPYVMGLGIYSSCG